MKITVGADPIPGTVVVPAVGPVTKDVIGSPGTVVTTMIGGDVPDAGNVAVPGVGPATKLVEGT